MTLKMEHIDPSNFAEFLAVLGVMDALDCAITNPVLSWAGNTPIIEANSSDIIETVCKQLVLSGVGREFCSLEWPSIAEVRKTKRKGVKYIPLVAFKKSLTQAIAGRQWARARHLQALAIDCPEPEITPAVAIYSPLMFPQPGAQHTMYFKSPSEKQPEKDLFEKACLNLLCSQQIVSPDMIRTAMTTTWARKNVGFRMFWDACESNPSDPWTEHAGTRLALEGLSFYPAMPGKRATVNGLIEKNGDRSFSWATWEGSLSPSMIRQFLSSPHLIDARPGRKGIKAPFKRILRPVVIKVEKMQYFQHWCMGELISAL